MKLCRDEDTWFSTYPGQKKLMAKSCALLLVELPPELLHVSLAVVQPHPT
jgi:hypothetical protein